MISLPSIRSRFRLLAAVALACIALPHATAQPAGLRTSSEYIAGFARYVYWPGEDRIAAWTVCIAGALPASEETAYDGRSVRGKPFVVRRLAESEAVDGCQILDLTAAGTAEVERRILSVRRLPVLTVGSGSSFCSTGGHICLHPAKAPYGFDINISSLRDAGLNVSARLLKLIAADFAALFDPDPHPLTEQAR